MLVLTRKEGQTIHMMDRKTKKVLAIISIPSIQSHQVKVGIEANDDIQIMRTEIMETKDG